MFFGHTHVDEFQIGYTNYSRQSAATAFSTSYIAPALTPTSGNPSFRVYSVDPVTWAVLDFTVYSANMSAPSYATTGPVWEKYYSVKQAYGSLLNPPYTNPNAELTPTFWHNVTELFETNDNVFQQYYARKSRGFNVATCDSTCKAVEICALRAAEAQYDCAVTKPGINFGKREESAVNTIHAAAHHDDCAGVYTPKIVKKIRSRLTYEVA